MTKIIELILPEEELNPMGVFAIGLVDMPAIETNWVYMSKDIAPIKFAKNEEKHIITGPVMIPDKKILRYDDNGEEYFVYISAPTIEKLSQNFLKNYNQKNFTFQHEVEVDGSTLVESWITGNNDKSKDLGFDLPKGTWMASAYIQDLELWEKIKDGTIKGFSIEAFLGEKIIKNSITEEEKLINQIIDLLENN